MCVSDAAAGCSSAEDGAADSGGGRGIVGQQLVGSVAVLEIARCAEKMTGNFLSCQEEIARYSVVDGEPKLVAFSKNYTSSNVCWQRGFAFDS
jgi:hypothetical protein